MRICNPKKGFSRDELVYVLEAPIPSPLYILVRGAIAALLFVLHTSLVTTSTGRLRTELGIDTRVTRLISNGYAPKREGPSLNDELKSFAELQFGNGLEDRVHASTSTGAGMRATFSDTLRAFAESNGHSFIPVPGPVLSEGRTMYMLGDARVAIDGKWQV